MTAEPSASTYVLGHADCEFEVSQQRTDDGLNFRWKILSHGSPQSHSLRDARAYISIIHHRTFRERQHGQRGNTSRSGVAPTQEID
jgi:hypothetical protein